MLTAHQQLQTDNCLASCPCGGCYWTVKLGFWTPSSSSPLLSTDFCVWVVGRLSPRLIGGGMLGGCACACKFVSWKLCLFVVFVTIKAFRYTALELLWVSSTIASLSDVNDAGDASLYSSRLLLHRLSSSGLQEMKYRHRPFKSTLHNFCPWRLLTAQHSFPEQFSLRLGLLHM